MNKQTTNGSDLHSLYDLRIGPGYDRGAALAAIDKAVGQIERILADMEKQDHTESTRVAFQRFMLDLAPALKGMGDRIRVQHNVSWIKIESMVNGHKVYISKNKLAVGRVDSTLPPELVPGARHAGRYNGRISSWLPADVGAVSEAIVLLGSEQIRSLKKRGK